MIVLNNGDKIRGDAGTAAEVDFTISGFVGTTATPLAGGQLANAIGDLYASGADATIVTGIILVNTGAGTNACNLYRYANGGTTERIGPKDISLLTGYALLTDGVTIVIISTTGQIVQTYSAHKDSHDPNDGSDKLDSANASEIAGVQAAGTGTSHSLARADHAHQIQASIADDHLVTIDDADAADDDYAKLTASGLEGRSYAEVLADIFSVDMPENLSMTLDDALSADGKWCGFAEDGTAGETLVFGDCVYFKAADSRWWHTDADAEATAFGKVGIVILAAGSGGNATKVLLWGKVRADNAFPALTIGAPVFIGTTAGDIQMTAPSGAADIVRVVGYGNTADELFFDPSKVWIKIAA